MRTSKIGGENLAMKSYSVRDVQRILIDCGYSLTRTKGSHQIWHNGSKREVLPVVKLDYHIANSIVKRLSSNAA